MVSLLFATLALAANSLLLATLFWGVCWGIPFAMVFGLGYWTTASD